jgi:hypothetical protein
VPQRSDYDELARRVAEAAADVNTALEVGGALQQGAGEPGEDPWGAETRSSRCGKFVFVDEAAEKVAAADRQSQPG